MSATIARESEKGADPSDGESLSRDEAFEMLSSTRHALHYLLREDEAVDLGMLSRLQHLFSAVSPRLTWV